MEVARRGETQASLCTRLREIERNSERECYVLGDRKQERASDEDAAWKTGGAGRERRGEPGVRERESKSGLDYRKDETLTSRVSGNFADAEEGVPSLPSNVG